MPSLYSPSLIFWSMKLPFLAEFLFDTIDILVCLFFSEATSVKSTVSSCILRDFFRAAVSCRRRWQYPACALEHSFIQFEVTGIGGAFHTLKRRHDCDAIKAFTASGFKLEYFFVMSLESLNDYIYSTSAFLCWRTGNARTKRISKSARNSIPKFRHVWFAIFKKLVTFT